MMPGLALLITGFAWSVAASLFALGTHNPRDTTNFHWTVGGRVSVWVLLLTEFVGFLLMVVGGVWTVVGSVV